MKKNAFTLAEVLITLGIIGVVAAMTLPPLIQNYRQSVINQQFKRAYSQLSNALVMVEHVAGYKPTCNETDGNNSMWNSDCYSLRDILFKKILPVVKICEGNALSAGCLPEGGYKGLDTIHNENNPDESEEDSDAADDYFNNNCYGMTKSAIENENYVYVMNDGTIYMLYVNMPAIVSIDVNGQKKTNKWGYDIFTFFLESGSKKPIYVPYKPAGGCAPVENGGKSTPQMFDEVF